MTTKIFNEMIYQRIGIHSFNIVCNLLLFPIRFYSFNIFFENQYALTENLVNIRGLIQK